MADFPYERCPFCDTTLEVVEEVRIQYCESCKDYVFYNPSSNSGAKKAAVEM